MSGLMLVAEICKEYGWTYQEYIDQPDFFLELIKEKYRMDNKARSLELKKYGR